MGGCEDERMYGTMICPKPLRFGGCIQARPIYHNTFNYHLEMRVSDSDSRSELLDMILNEGDVLSSSPFNIGSPPTRAMNPVIQDVEFSSTVSLSSRTGARMQYGYAPATVRIEGFDCRVDSGSRSVSAVA